MINIIHHKTQEIIYDYVLYFSYFLMFVSSLGLSIYAPKYLHTLTNVLSVYVSLVLLWRFNPFREKIKFTNLDRKIAFSAGLFMITTTFLNKYIELIKQYIVEQYTKIIKPYLHF